MSDNRLKIFIIDDGESIIPHMALDILNRYQANVVRVTPDCIHSLENKTLIELDNFPIKEQE